MESVKNTGEVSESIGERLAGKYLTFMLGEEEYGVEILKVQEIIRMQEITTLPRTPDFIRGIINLRGRLIPVIDLRRKFGMEGKDDTDKTCIVVVQVGEGDGTITMGITIDDVREVRDLLPEEIEEAPSFGTAVDIAFIIGIAKVDGRVKLLLDIGKVLTSSELSAVADVGK